MVDMPNVNEFIEEFDRLQMSSDDKDIEIIKSISLSAEEINGLTIDNLLDLKSRNIIIKVNGNNKFNIRWKEEGLDVSDEKQMLIIDAVKALSLKIKLEQNGIKYYKKGLNDVMKLGDKFKDKNLITKILDLDFGKKPKESVEKKDSVGFNDIFNIINLVSVKNKDLNTMGGKVDYIINKLEIEDITEVVFVILTLAAIEDADKEE